MAALKFLKMHWGKLAVLLVILYFVLPFDDIEEHLGLTSGRVRFVLNHGRLAPLPRDSTDFKARHNPSWFTDIYFVYFVATPEVISDWLKHSPGVEEGRTEILPNGSTRYYLKTAGSAGHLDVSADGKQVGIEMGSSWDGLGQAPLVPRYTGN